MVGWKIEDDVEGVGGITKFKIYSGLNSMANFFYLKTIVTSLFQNKCFVDKKELI